VPPRSQTSGLASGSAFPVGITTNTFTVTAANGQTASCSFTVTVTDNEPPAITCPGNISENNNLTLCSAVVTYTDPVGTDNCPGATTLLTSGLASGATYPVGVTTNVFTVTASNGQSTTCAFTVTVTDNEPPTITCPGNISVNNAAGQCSAVVNYTAPVGTDNCSGATTVQTSGLASDATYPVGVTTNVFTVTAANDQSTTCAFTVTVTDNEAPSLSCKLHAVSLNAMSMASITPADVYDTGSDNCGTVNLVSVTPNSFACGNIGGNLVTLLVNDGNGNTAVCNAIVVVQDVLPPSIICPPALSAQCSLSEQPAYADFAAFTAAGGSASDNCTLNNSSFELLDEGISPMSCPQTVQRIYRIGDVSNNVATCLQVITLDDTQAPSLTVPTTGLALGCNPTLPTTASVVAASSATDNCGTPTITAVAGSVVATGCNRSQTFTITATDGCGNTDTGTVTYTWKEDTQPPTLTVPTTGLELGCNPVTLPNEGLVVLSSSASDNCGAVNLTGAAGSIQSNGCNRSQTITVTATDGCGNTTSLPVTYTWTVTTAPVLANVPAGGYLGYNPNPLPSCDAGVTASNECGSVSVTCTPGAITMTGCDRSQTFTYSATACALTTSAEVTYTWAVDTEPPTITCPDNISVNNDPGLCSAVVNYTAPVGTDNCSGATTAQTTGLASGVAFPVGVTTNTFTVTAANGQTASCSFTVTVADNEPPAITCPDNISVNNDAGLCSAVVTYTAPVGTDNCSPVITIQTSGLLSGQSFPVGVTTNTFRVTAANGQSTTCAFTVTVTDNEPPTITCPANISVDATGGCGAVVHYIFPPEGTDNCPGVIVVASPPSGSVFPVGVSTVTAMATDVANNTNSCQFTVTVTDVQNPVITTCPVTRNIAGCFSDLTGPVYSTTSAPSSLAEFTNGVNQGAATDDCAITSVTYQDAASGTCPIVVTRTWTVSDAAGNTANCTQTINITPTQASFTSPPGNITVACWGVPAVSGLGYTNGLSGDCLISGSVTSTQSAQDPAGVCGGTITETWTFTDVCGRTITHSRTITVEPAEQAAFLSLPGFMSIPCSAAPPTGTSLPYSNAQGPSCAIIGSVTGVISGSHTACGGSYTETWTFTDACDRTISHIRVISVTAAPAASFTSLPGNISIPCDAAPPTGTSLSYTNGQSNACDISGSVTGVITGSHTACGGSYTETWTFTDACNRTISHSRTITVEPAPLP
jgi:hypothetical protein